jgi:hypothetical protein
MQILTEQQERRRRAMLWHMRIQGWAKRDMQYLEYEQEEIEEDEKWARAQIAHCGSLNGVGDPTDESFCEYPAATPYEPPMMRHTRDGYYTRNWSTKKR